MSKYIFQIKKKELEEFIQIILYYVKLDNKNKLPKTQFSEHKLEYSILLLKKDYLDLKLKNDKIILSDETFYNKNKQEVVKLIIKNKQLYDYFLKQLKQTNLTTFESDLSFEHKYIIENNLSLLSNQKKAQKTTKINLNYLCFDIETIGEKENIKIVMISTYSLYDKNLNLVLVNLEHLDNKNQFKDLDSLEFDIKFLDSEQSLLNYFKNLIKTTMPQIIFGWNVIDFDFKIIKKRCEKLGINFNFSNFIGDTKLRINKDFFIESKLNMQGILVFDVINILKSNFIIFSNYKLNTVAKQVLDDKKIDVLENDDENLDNKIIAIQNLLKKDPLKLAKYNFKDSKLVSQIIEKLNLLDLMINRTTITNTPLEKVKSPIASLDIMYLKKLHKQKIVANSNYNFQSSKQIEGAYVIEPKTGFYKNIFVFDFKSLYSTIIMTFNIDPFTYDLENGQIIAPNNAKFLKKKGILPTLINDLFKARELAKKEKNSIKNIGIKTTMNSFYGAIASPKSRFYNREIASAITSFGRNMINLVKEYITKSNFQVIYGDTDSIFVNLNKDFQNFDSKKKFGFELENQINKFISNWVKENFGQKNHLKIELERIYSNFFIASKKRYVGFDQISNKLNFVGMEFVRGDWTNLAKNFQKELINMIFEKTSKDNIKKFILNYVNELKKGKFDELLIYEKKITKPLKYYTKTTPPHVKAAREIKNFSGRDVKYVMTNKGPKHIIIYKKFQKELKYDYEHYIEKQLKGVSDDILNHLNLDFDKIIFFKKQKSLTNFF